MNPHSHAQPQDPQDAETGIAARRAPPVVDAEVIGEEDADMAASSPAADPSGRPESAYPEGFMAKLQPLLDTAHRAFTEHPAAAGETYWQHLWFTISMGARLMMAGFVIVLHGILPFTLTYTGSNMLKKCNKILSERAVKAQMPCESAMPFGDHI